MPPSTITPITAGPSTVHAPADKARHDRRTAPPKDGNRGPGDDALPTSSLSQNLTAFDDTFEPPSSSSLPDSKGLAGEIQGGFTGLYHKFRASVGGMKDPDLAITITRQDSDKQNGHSLQTKTPSLKSPRMSISDQHATHDSNPALKFSSKSHATAKLSLPTSPVPLSNRASQPPAAEQPPQRLKTHSRTTSTQDTADDAHRPRGRQRSSDDHIIHQVSSRADEASSASTSRSTRRLQSTDIQPLTRLDTRLGHERGLSDPVSTSQLAKTAHKSQNSSNNIIDKQELTKVVSQQLHNAEAPDQAIHPLDFLAEPHHIVNGKPAGDKSHRLQNDEARLLDAPTDTSSQLKLQKPKITHAKLPGYGASRASSTDTEFTQSTQPGKASHFSNGGHPGDQSLDYQQRLRARRRNRLLHRDYWMKDENARDCFRCGDTFSTFRRKHHCRTCGQIFDNKCTTLLAGSYFDVNSPVRVCKPCEATIVTNDDDSSDYSVDDLPVPDSAIRPRTPEEHSARYDDDNISIISQSLDQMTRTPTMGLPVRRAYDKNNRSSAILTYEDHVLHRPGSSRSLHMSNGLTHGHKRHHSKHQHIRTYKAYHDDRAPFQRRTLEDLKLQKESAFHRDSVIDPELAQYLSDDASSGEEPSLHVSRSSDKLSRSGPDSDKSTISGLLAAVRKGRSRIGDRSLVGLLNLNKDADDAASIISTRAIDGNRSSRRRNLSVASSVHHRLTPKATRERLQIVLPPGHDDEAPSSPALNKGSRMMRSASMRGMSAPHLELNRASIQHVHKLLEQLLRDARVPRVSSWKDALIPILLRATDDVDPDVENGDDIDIRNYVKLKKIPGGRPSDTAYISGLVFTKNVALKSMARTMHFPRILIITFPLEYARSEQHFMSLDPVIRQEREYLENMIGRIAALKPDVLLASKNISGLALELLDKAKITAIYNVRPSLLEAASRCTQTRVNHTMDKLSAAHGQLGMCDLFEIKTFVAEGRKKTYVYFSGCPPALGCTITLRGADRRTLATVKRITDFMIYVVYNLKLETCLMRDEWATIPGNSDLTRSSVNTVSEAKGQTAASSPEDSDNIQLQTQSVDALKTDADTTETDANSTTNSTKEALEHTESNYIPDDIPVPTFYEDLADKHLTKILSASPFVKFSQPYLLMRARELERRVAYLKRLRDQDLTDNPNSDEKIKAQKFTLIQPEMVHSSLEGASKKVREIVHAVHDTEYDKALYLYETQKKQWETYLSGNRNLFDPYAHQNICVLFSQISLETHVPCFGPDLLAFSYYNEHEQEQEDHFEADCTLGQYVEDLCYRANNFCMAEACGKTLFDHSRVYVHGEASIHVSMQPYPAKMKGLQDSILMWSFCKVCSTETNVMPMSSSTWKYSFGKYLELSFWSADLHARAGACLHDIHRDHIRFFGYKDIALSFQYNKINLVEVVVPRLQITWNVDNDLRFRNNVFGKLEHRITKFMGSVKLRLKSINVDALLPDPAKAEECRAEIDRLACQANDDHTALIKQLQELYMRSKHWEIIPLNRAMRSLAEKVADWDKAFYAFEQTYFPSEREIGRLANLQLRKIFLEKDVSVTSLTSAENDSTTPPDVSMASEKGPDPEGNAASRKLSLEKTQNVLQSVLEEHVGGEAHDSTDCKGLNKESAGPQTISNGSKLAPSDLEHLDLAVSSSVPKSPGPPAASHFDEIADRDKATDSSQTLNARRRAVNATIQSNEADSRLENTVNAQNEPSLVPRPTTQHHSSSSASQGVALSRSTSPKLLRAQSQPAGSLPQQKDNSQIKVLDTIASKGPSAFQAQQDRTSQELGPSNGSDVPEKSLSERFGFNTLKNSKLVKAQSFIPRSIANRKDSRVSSLAKHFEELSREFERQRIRDRRLRTSKQRQSRAYPLAAPKPTVEVYKDVYEAVDENDSSGQSLEPTEVRDDAHASSSSTAQALAETNAADTTGGGFHAEENVLGAGLAENEAEMPQSSQAPSDADLGSENEVDDVDDMDDIVLPDSPEDLLRLSQEDVDLKEIPKHERTSVYKMLSNFWDQRSSSGWPTLEYPFGASDHLYADCDIIVREDELSSIIAYTLDSTDYRSTLEKIQIHTHETVVNDKSVHAHPDEVQAEVMHSLLRKTGSHFTYRFSEGPATMTCKAFFAEQFDAMRRKCGVDDRFVESMSRCMKFDSRGGKSKSLFLKTLDDRFVLKSLSPVERDSFLKFAPNYFQIMSEAFFHELPSVIAKMLGFYQVIIRNPISGVEHNWFLLVMENLFYDRKPDKIFDLKGSMRNRKIEETGDSNEVLLDENMVDYIYESPLFAREHSKKLLRSSVHNDTLFLEKQNVMDYSLMIAIKDDRSELVVGIIDCIRTYTWDKKLESWIKDRGFAGGGKNKPTVTSPKEYKRRFREAMSRYVLEAPSCWHQFRPVKPETRARKATDGDRQERDIGDDVLQALT